MGDSRMVLKFLERKVRDAKLSAMVAAGGMAHEARKRCEDLISARDHTLQDLARMGHPYSKAHPDNPHDPPEVVHVQSGALISGLTEDAPSADSQGARARVHNVEVELDERIQLGTPTMIARPYMRTVRRVYRQEILDAGLRLLRRRSAR
jgi:hypothetical protein